jgi:hypothetical protein
VNHKFRPSPAAYFCLCQSTSTKEKHVEDTKLEEIDQEIAVENAQGKEGRQARQEGTLNSAAMLRAGTIGTRFRDAPCVSRAIIDGAGSRNSVR